MNNLIQVETDDYDVFRADFTKSSLPSLISMISKAYDNEPPHATDEQMAEQERCHSRMNEYLDRINN